MRIARDLKGRGGARGGWLLSFALALALPGRTMEGQGLAGASLWVRVVGGAGAPVPGATVVLSATRTGAVRRQTAGNDGTARFDVVEVGVYRVEARALGMRPSALEGVTPALGERLALTMTLQPGDPQALAAVEVVATEVRDPGSGGPAQALSRATIRAVPMLNRDFTGLTALASTATGPTGLSISGQHPRFNSLQVDGATTNDLSGISLTPGSRSGGRALSMEAVEEARILVAPFDVRQGGFTGGQISAVTRSGTNRREGAIFSLYSRSALVGSDTAGTRVSDFDQLQLGISGGGPIIRDRLHYFGVVETEARSTLYDEAPVGDAATGVTDGTAQRIRQLVNAQFGFDPGGAAAVSLARPNTSYFLKLSWLPGSRHVVSLTHSWTDARSALLSRTLRTLNNSDGYQLANSGSTARSRVAAVGLRVTSSIGRLTNEAIVSSSDVRDATDSRTRAPLFLVQGDVPGTYVAAGSVKGAQGTRTNQRLLEVTNNTTLSLGSHLLTVGTQNLAYQLDDNFLSGRWGVFTFADTTALQRNTPSRYEVALPLGGRDRERVSAVFTSLHAQDRWQVGERLTLSAGLRMELPLLNAPRRNAALASNASLDNLDTRALPSGRAAWSPRLSFTWTPDRAARTLLRGGIGTFTGRPLMVWLGGAFAETGDQATTLTCQAAGSVPAATTDVAALPTECLTRGTRSLPFVTSFDDGFRPPQATKYALGLDHAFARTLAGSIDLVLTQSRHNLTITDANLVASGRNAEGRMMYGTIVAGGAARPSRRDSLYGPVYRYGNASRERSISASANVHKSWGGGGLARVSYSWSLTEDVMSVTGLNSTAVFRNNPLDGALEQRSLRRSARDVPHTALALLLLPIGGQTHVSMFYLVRSGMPYAYVTSRDVNGDGAPRNDLTWVPRDSADITLSNPEQYAALQAYIDDEPCLRQARGRLMTRNACRNPVVQRLDMRLARTIALAGTRRVEVLVDLFNAPSLVRGSWGLVRETSPREDLPLLSVGGWDAARNRPVYTVPAAAGRAALPSLRRVVPDDSRWRIQLGARYAF